MNDRKKILIGPSTGWLYAIEIFSLKEQEDILRKANSTAIELCLGSSLEKDDKRILSLTGSERFGNFNYVGLHIPDFDQKLDSEYQISLTKKLVNTHKVMAVLIHPLKVAGEYPRKYFDNMIAAEIPLAIENMDSRKESGFEIKELNQLVFGCNIKFVLDVQHAYEHDASMKYALDLFDSLCEKLTHLHISGQTKNNIHSLVHKAENSKAIVELIGKILSKKKIPLILEGEYKNLEELSAEIEFLTKELRVD